MADNYQQNKVTTSGLTIFDENGIMLRLSYLDESFSLIIGEPTVAENGKKSYPQESRCPFILTFDRAQALYQNIIIEKVLPVLENGEDYNGGVFLNRRKDAIFEIRVHEGDIYLVYHKDIGEDRQPKVSHVFKCQKTSIVEKYSTDGSSFEQSDVQSYFMLFCKYIESGLFDINNACTHSYRRANHYTTSKIFDYLEGIAAKMGVTLENRSFKPSTSNAFMENNNAFSADAPVQTQPAATTLDGLLG